MKMVERSIQLIDIFTLIDIFNTVVEFTKNRAGRNGGAIFLESGATLTIRQFRIRWNRQSQISALKTSENYAKGNGGTIYHLDSPTSEQCLHHPAREKVARCFLQLKEIPQPYWGAVYVNSTNDTSGSGDGNFLFGGILNKCRIDAGWRKTGLEFLLYYNIMSVVSIDRSGKDVTSDAYALCFCHGNQANSFTCEKQLNVSVYRGEVFTISILAAAQTGTTSTLGIALTNITARLEAFQSTQTIQDGCHNLHYTVYSTQSYEKVRIYADAPCRDSGDAGVTINAVILPCPSGFELNQDICVCEDRLQNHAVDCVIPYFTKQAYSNFWMGVSYGNGSYQGLILASPCPLCKPKSVQLTLNDLESQCDFNRAGLLCGGCAANHSIVFGNSYCQICSDSFLALIVPFALMGIALVAFLTLLRLTVASGVLNSLILYCNIVQTIRTYLIASNAGNLLTIFIAWMNLDFGFQTCFYNGLDAYVQTWLQFVFPLYVWLLIGSIILISRYSITMSKLIGHNPVAVLGTLILMSYNKILKIIVEVFSSAELEYPDNVTVTVWLKDANVPYLQSRHLIVLTIATSLVLIFFFLPYTFLLLFGHKLYRFTGRRCFEWLNRIKPLLEAYYAPYKVKTRYWTGLLLLVRCGLYIIFLRFSQSQNKVFMSIILTFTILGFKMGILFSGRIYRKLTVNIIEAFIYLNLITLAAAAQAGLNSEPFVYTLIALVFAILVCTCGYQFHLLYIAKTSTWQKLKEKILNLRPKKQNARNVTPVVNPSLDPHRIVTKTVIELREPLMESK